MKKIISYFTFSGRINRLEYTLWSVLIWTSVFALRDSYPGYPQLIIFLCLYLYITTGAKRCHDRGLFGLMVLNPANFIFNFTDKGNEGENAYGPVPGRPNWLDQLIFFFKRIYVISISFKKKQDKAWLELKEFFKNSNWSYGIFENEKHIQCQFEIDEAQQANYFYVINDIHFICMVQVLNSFSEEQASDVFILTSHINNFSPDGVVKINIQENYVHYMLKRDFMIPLLYTSELYDQIITHYSYSKDIHWAFQKLIEEEEAPAIIIGDFIRRFNEKTQS